MAALEANLEQFKRRWRIKTEEMEFLEQIKMVPTCIEEAIWGFWPRSDQAKRAIWWSNVTKSKDFREDVLLGNRSVFNCMINKVNFFEEDTHVELLPETGHPTVDRRVRGILSARKRTGRLRVSHTRPLTVRTLVAKKNKLFKSLKEMYSELDDDAVAYFHKPAVKVHLTPMTRRDRNPQSMGTVVNNNIPSRQEIACIKYLNCYYRGLRNDDEEVVKIADLPDEEFEKEMLKLSEMKKIEGMKVVSPSGLPPVNWLDGIRYVKTHAFSFSVDLEAKSNYETSLTFRGTEIIEIKPCLWGGKTLESTSGSIIACAIGKLEEKNVVMFKQKHRPLEVVEMEHRRKGMHFVEKTINGKVEKIYYLNDVTDYSTIRQCGLTNTHEMHITGSPDAIGNYGGYLHSSTNTGFRTMQKMYREKNGRSELHEKIRKFCNVYPTFPENCTTFSGHQNYNIIGDNVGLLRLEQGEGEPVQIDTTSGARNVILTPYSDIMTDDDMLF
jgi:hypothetical protein